MERYALQKLQELLRQRGVELRASSVSYNLGDLSATLRDVEVRSAAAPDLPAVVSAGFVQVDIGLRALLRGSFVVQKIWIEDFKLHVAIDEQGRSNIPQLPESEPSEEPLPDFLIEFLRATAGSFTYEDRGRGVAVELPLWKLSITGDGDTWAHEVRFDLERSGTVRIEERTLPVDGISLDAGWKKETVRLNGFVLQAGGSRVEATGDIDGFGNPAVDLELSGVVDLEEVARFAASPEQIGGTLRLKVRAAGKLDGIKVTSNVTGEELSAVGFRRGRLAASSTYDAAGERLELSSLSLRSPTGNVAASGTFALAQGAGESRLTARADALDVEVITRRLNLPVQIASSGSARMDARWQGIEFKKAEGSASVRLAAAREGAAKDVLPVSAALSATARGNRIVIGIESAEALGTRTEGTVAIESLANVTGELRTALPSVETTLSQVAAFQGQSREEFAGIEADGEVSVTTTLAGTFERPQAAVAIRAPSLTIGEFDGIAVALDTAYDPDQVEVQNASVTWRGQAVTAGGTIKLRGEAPALDLRARIENASVAEILGGLGKGEIPAEGSVSLDAVVQGDARNPSGELTVAATGLRAYGEAIGRLDVEARLADRKINLAHLRLEKPTGEASGRLEASGTFDLDAKAYTVQAEAEGLRVSDLTLPDVGAIRALVNLRAEGSGTVDDPRLDLNLNLSGIEAMEKPLGTLSAYLRVADGTATAALSAPAFRLAGGARVGIKAPHPFVFGINAQGTDLEDLPFELGQPIAGVITAGLRGSGSVEEWQRASGSLRVSNLDLRWKGLPVAAKGTIEAGFAEGVLTIAPSTIAAGDSTLMLAGSLPLEEADGHVLQVQGNFDLAGLLPYVTEEPPVAARGTVHLDGSVRGSLRRPAPAAVVRMEGGEIAAPDVEPPLSNVGFEVELKDGAVTLHRASAEWAKGKIEAQGRLPLGLLPGELPEWIAAAQGDATINLSVRGLQLAEVKGAPEDISGTVSVSAEARASALELQAVTARATVDELRVDLDRFHLEQRAPGVITLREGTVQVERFELQGPETRLQIGGTLGLEDPRPVDLRAVGTLDAAILSLFAEGVRAEGPTRVGLAVTGSAEHPVVSGSLELSKGQVAVPAIGLRGENLDLKVELGNERASITRLTGTVNGGTLTGKGGLGFGDGEIKDIDVEFDARNVYFNLPEGLRTVSDSNIRIRSRGEHIVIGGQVKILEGTFRDPLTLEGGLLRYLRSGQGVELTEERNPLLSRIRFDLGVTTAGPIAVENNLARLALMTDLRLVNEFYRPSLTGRLRIEEGGELYLAERTYLVDRGIITFNNPQRIQPGLDILTRARVNSYDIILQIAGEMGDIRTTIRDESGELTEAQATALLFTGRTDTTGAGAQIARDQAASLLAASLGGTLTRPAQQALGVSQIRLEPNLIAAESDPSARLTIGQNFTRNLSFVYSMNLADSGDQIWIAEYDIRRRFITRGIKQNDNSYRVEFRHNLRFGGVPAFERSAQRKDKEIGSVTFGGNPLYPEEELFRRFKVKPGDTYDFFKVRKSLDRLEDFYHKQDLLESRVRMDRETSDKSVDLHLEIEPGLRVQFVYEGWDPPSGVKKKIREIWANGVFDAQRSDEAIRELRAALAKDGRLEAKIGQTVATPAENDKRVVFEIEPGVRYRNVGLLFHGAEGLSQRELERVVRDQKLTIEVHTEPRKVTEFLTRYYRDRGYLDVKIGQAKPELDPAAGTGSVVFGIHEGPRYNVGRLLFEGNTAYSDEELRSAIALAQERPYEPELRERSLLRIQDLYWEKGYNNVEISYRLNRGGEAGVVDFTFDIQEGRQQIVKEVRVEGTDLTTESLVRSQIALKPGDVVRSERLGMSRRNLYETGAYALVDIEAEPIPGGDPDAAQQAARIVATVREVQPFDFRYGAFFDTDRGPGFIADLANRNSLGAARVLGLRTRYDSEIQEGRLYFSQPVLRGLPLRTNATSFIRREIRPTFMTDRTGFTAQQEIFFKKHYMLTYGYRLERTHTFDREPDPFFPFDISLWLAPLTTSFTRESRDDFLDATRGSFSSHALEYAPQRLGSQLSYVKYFGQFFKYVPLGKPMDIPFSNVKKPRLVYAGGVRVGLASGLGGQTLVPSERFFAGGGTTVRGFVQNGLGPADDFGPTGGDALLVVNNELRFPIAGMFDGVGFVDVGNVYRRVTDFNPLELQKSTGVGLRVRTPYFLLRFDYGFRVGRRPGEPHGRFFFSIGQAF